MIIGRKYVGKKMNEKQTVNIELSKGRDKNLFRIKTKTKKK